MNVIRTAVILTTVAVLATPAFADDMGDMKGAKAQSYDVTAQNGSGETGTVKLAPAGPGATTVTVTLKGAPADAQPAHIHPGSCAKLDPKPMYPLTNVVNGTSTTVVKTSIDKLTAGGFAVNVHKSTSDLATYVACADLADKDDASNKKMR